jgi:hypothetical protein
VGDRSDDVDDNATLVAYGDAVDLAARVPTLMGAALATIAASVVWARKGLWHV